MVLEPVVNVPRRTIGKSASINPDELNGKINYFTTSGFKGSSEHERNILMIKEMANLQGKFVFGADWQLAVGFGRGETKAQILAKKEKFNAIQKKEEAIQKKEEAHNNQKAELEAKHNSIVWVLPDAGWRLVEKNIAPSDWAKINPIYYSSQDLEEMDYFTNSPGWRIGKESIAKLISLGYTIINCNTLEIVS